MNRYTSVLFFFICLNTNVFAQKSFELTDEDRQHINETTQDYNQCLQQNALQQLDNYADIRQVAAQAVNLCGHKLIEFREKLGSRANSDFYSGYEDRIKNSAIRNILPLLMYEKSARRSVTSDD